MYDGGEMVVARDESVIMDIELLVQTLEDMLAQEVIIDSMGCRFAVYA